MHWPGVLPSVPQFFQETEYGMEGAIIHARLEHTITKKNQKNNVTVCKCAFPVGCQMLKDLHIMKSMNTKRRQTKQRSCKRLHQKYLLSILCALWLVIAPHQLHMNAGA